jgi:minichromosome maintenance protein 10
LKALAEVQSARKNIALGPRPGPKIRSGVVAPSTARAAQGVPRDLGDSEDDLAQALFDKPLVSKMVDLDE